MGSVDLPPFLRDKMKQQVQEPKGDDLPPFLKKKSGGQGVLSGAKTSLKDVGLEVPSTSGIDFSGLQKAANEGVTGEMMKAKPEVFSQQKIKPSFLNPQEAAKHLETKLKERKVKARPKVELATTQEEAVFRFPEDIKDNQLDRYDLNDIKDNLKDNWEKQAFDIYQKDRNKKASIEKYGISEEAALDYAASQGDKDAERMKYSPPVSKKKLESVVGSKMMDFLYDEDVMKIAEQNPEFAEQWRQNAETLYDKYPTVANKVVAQKIGQYREDSGRGGLLVDIPTKGGVDEVVEEMIANGKLTDKEKQIYQNELRPKIGVLNSIGRGFGNTFAPAFTNDAPIQTTDFLGSLQDSYKNTLRSTAHAIEDLNAASTGGLLSVDKEARLNDITDREYKTPTVEAKGTLSKAAQGGGHLVGFVVPMILGGEAKIPELASSALTFGGINEDAALRMFPDNQMKQAAYTALATGFDVFAGKYLLPKNILGDAKKEFSSEISKVINGFTDKTLTTEAAKKTALDIGEKIAKKHVPDLVKGNVKTATVLGGFNIFHNGVDAAFGGRDVSMDDVAHQAIEDFKTNLLAATPLTAAGIYGRYNKSAARGLREAASNIDYYKEKLQDDIALDPESAPQKTEALKNLEVAAKINNDVKDLPVTEKQKDKYVLHSVVENIWKQKADATTDTNLKEQYNQKAKDAKSVKEQILNGNTNEEIAPESEIKKQEEEEKRQTDLKRLEEDKKLADEKWKQKRSEVDGREGDAAKLKIKELEKEKERLDEDYEKKVAKLQPKQEEVIDPLEKAVNEGRVKGVYADLFKQGQGEAIYKEVAQQSQNIGNDGSKIPDGKDALVKKATIDQFGEDVVNAAIEKYPAEAQVKDEGLSSVEKFADRIANGEKMETPEDLQFYENNKTEIEKILQAKAQPSSKASSVENKLRITEETIDVKDEVTGEKIGERKLNNFNIDFSDGARAMGFIKNNEATITGINAARESSATPKRGTKVFNRVLEQLAKNGVTSIKIGNQSQDTRIALKKLVEKGILENPRDNAGISVDEYPTRFDIAKEPPPQPQASSVDEITVGEMIDKVGTYKGEKGQFYQDGQTVVFKVDGKNKEYELGNVDEIKESPISDFDIQHEQSVVGLNEKGNVDVRGKEYVNNYSDPLQAINKDAEGNVVSVNLETADGQKRTFRGNIAEDIAYQISLKEITKDNETRSEFEQFINTDESATKEMESARLPEATTQEPSKTPAKVSREKVQPKPKTVTPKSPIKEPKVERSVATEAESELPSADKTEKATQLTESQTEKVGKPPTEPPKEDVAAGGEGDAVGITHAANEVRRKDRALPEYERKAESFEEWNNEAEQKIKAGYDVEKLMGRIEKGHDPTPVENSIRKIYIATLDAEIAKNPTDELLAKQKRFIEIGDLANSRAGKNLVSLKGEGSPLSTISDFYVAKMEAAGVDKLTEQQKKDTKEAFDKVQKADENATAAMEAYRDEISKLRAENELLKAAKEKKNKPSGKPKTKEDYVKERQSLKEKLAAAKKEHEDYLKSQGIQKMGFGSFTTKEAKIILDIVKSHVDEIGNNLAEVTKRVINEVKDLFEGIDEKDIRNILEGQFNEKKPTRNELAAKMRDLKDEAYYINKLERLLSGTEPKKESEKIKRNQQISELQKKIKDFQKEERDANKFSKEEFDSDLKKLQSIKKRNEQQEKEIRERIKNKDFETKKEVPFLEDPEMQKKFPKQFNETLDAIVKKEEARHEFDIALLRDQMARRSNTEKFTDVLGKTAGTVKAITTGIDDSAVAIQTYMAALRRPRTGAKAFYLHVSHAFSAKRFNRWLAQLHNSSDWKDMKDDGLDVSEPQSLKEREKEEIFNNRYSGTVNIKVKGKVHEVKLIDVPLKPFERAFTTLGNVSRVQAYRNISRKYKDEGYTREKDPELFKSLARRLNTETGRGALNEHIDKASKIVTLGIWSPRLMAQKFNILGVSDLASIFLSKAGTKGYYRQLHPKERAAAIRDVAQFAVTVAALSYGFALAFGGEVDDDPLSSTFMDIKLPNGKSYNFTGGFSSVIRHIAQFATGKKRQDGKLVDAPRLGTLGRYFRGKTPPVTSAALNLAGGKNFMGQPTTPTDELINLAPISVRGIWNQIQNDGSGSFLTQGIPTFFGLNVKNEKDYEGVGGKTFSIKDSGEETGKPPSKRQATAEEKASKEKLQEELYNKEMERLKDKTIYLDRYGDVIVTRTKDDPDEFTEDDEGKEVAFKDLTKDQLKQLQDKIKRQMGNRAKNRLFGEGQDED